MVNRNFCSLWHNYSFKYYVRSKKLVLEQAALREFDIDDDTLYDAYTRL